MATRTTASRTPATPRLGSSDPSGARGASQLSRRSGVPQSRLADGTAPVRVADTTARPAAHTPDLDASDSDSADHAAGDHAADARAQAQPRSHARAQARDGMWREPLVRVVARRMVSVPGLTVLTGAYLALLPALLVYSIAADAIRRRPMVLARFHLAMVGMLLWHFVGLAALLLWWIAGLRWLGRKPRDWVHWYRRLEGWWGSHAIGLIERLWGVQVEIAGDEQLAPGPVLVFARHTSIVDTMLPLRIVEHRRGMIARIVKKRELLWDPCVDWISHRMPRAFVRRGSGAPEREIEHLRALTAGMGERDALWMYPEGTRFTPDKRARVLARLRERHPDAARRAERLHHTLPPRPGGALALLDDCPGMDVVFCAHTGMEPAGRLEDMISGALLGRRFRVQFWRVSAAEIPASADDRMEWLHDWWERIDRWVAENQASGERPADAAPARPLDPRDGAVSDASRRARSAPAPTP